MFNRHSDWLFCLYLICRTTEEYNLFEFIGVHTATTYDFMMYMIYRPNLHHDLLDSILIVESKHVGYCMVFIPSDNENLDWMLFYHVEDSRFESVLESIIEDAKHRSELLNRYDGIEWFTRWQI